MWAPTQPTMETTSSFHSCSSDSSTSSSSSSSTGSATTTQPSLQSESLPRQRGGTMADNPQEIVADLENWRLSQCQRKEKEQENDKTANDDQQSSSSMTKQISLWGVVDPEITSSVVQRLFAAGASSLTAAHSPKALSSRSNKEEQDPPITMEQQQDLSFTSSSYPLDSMCGSISQLWGIGAEAVAVCHGKPEEFTPPLYSYYYQTEDTASEMEETTLSPVLFKQQQQQQELRVLEIAEDLNRVRQSRQEPQQNNKPNPSSTRQSGGDTSDNAQVDISHETPYDEMGDFLEYNSSSNNNNMEEEQIYSIFDPTSFRDFESVLQRVVAVFGMDDDEDDSMVSADSASGYEASVQSQQQQQDASSQPAKDETAQKKGTSSEPLVEFGSSGANNSSSKDATEMEAAAAAAAAAARIISEVVADPEAPLFILSDDDESRPSNNTSGTSDADGEEGEVDNIAGTTTNSSRDEIASHDNTSSLVAKALDGNTNSINESSASALDLSGMMTMTMEEATDYKQHKSSNSALVNATMRYTCCSLSSNNDQLNSTVSLDNNKSFLLDTSTDSEYTITTGTSMTAIKKQLQVGNRNVIDKYIINPNDNSLISETPFEPSQRIQKPRYRFRKNKGDATSTTAADAATMDTIDAEVGNNENTEACPVLGGFDRTVDDLAFLLGQGSQQQQNQQQKQKQNQQQKQDLNGIDREALLDKLKEVSPELHSAVLARIVGKYQENPHPSPTNVKGRESPTAGTTGTKGMESPLTAKGQSLRSISSITPDRPYWADQNEDNNSENLPPDAAVRQMKGVLPMARGGTSKRLPPRNGAAKKISGLPKAAATPMGIHSDDRVDESRGSYWSEVLDVAEDDLPSFEIPSISIDDASFSIVQELCKMESHRPVDGSFLDNMIDGFLTKKVDSLNALIDERKMIMALREKLFEELKNTPNTLNHRRVAFVTGNGSGTPSVQLGQALIRKLQRKRQALTLVRRREEQAQVESKMRFSTHGGPSSVSVTVTPPCVPEPELQPNHQAGQNVSSNKGNKSLEEVKWEEFLTGTMAPSTVTSSGSKSLTSKEAFRRVKEKRLKLRLGRSTLLASQTKPQRESLDYAVDNEESGQAGSLTTKYKSPPEQPVLPSLQKAAKKDHKYEILPEQNTRCSCSEMRSGDMLQALAPPSPESPNRVCSQLESLQPNDTTTSIADLHAVAAGDLSGDSGRMLVFLSDTEKSDSSANIEPGALGDSFGEIVVKSVKKRIDVSNNNNIEISIRKKSSPTSIADFGEQTHNFHREESFFSKGFSKYAGEPGVLDESDQFLHTAMDMSMLQDDDEFWGADFQFPSKFEI